jgi:hypothetical protein
MVAHGAVASRSFGKRAQDVLGDWRAAWRAGVIDDRLGTMFDVLEQITLMATGHLNGSLARAHRAGVTRRALISAAYINFGFNVINRVADGVGVRLPKAASVDTAARLLLAVGYRPLAGRPFASVMVDSERSDPFEPFVDELCVGAVHGAAALDRHVREELYAGTASGPLGELGRAVGESAWTITASDTSTLHAQGFVDDQLFEAIICSALGAGRRRLDLLLRLMRSWGTHH